MFIQHIGHDFNLQLSFFGRALIFRTHSFFCGGAMSRTSELTRLPGVAAAGLFSRKGFLEEFEGTMTVAEATEMANLCSDITMNIELQGRLLGRLADKAAWDGQGWITFGPDMAVVAIGDSACMVKSGQASFNQVIRAMAESAGG